MNTWEKVKFGEVIHFPPKIKMKKGVEYPFIPMENLDSNNKFAKPLSSKVLKGGGAKFEEGDTLFARITPCLQNGKISQAKDLNGTPGFGSTEFFVFRGIDGITDTDFIYYLSKTKFIRESAENSMVGASGRQRADAGFLKNLEIKLPPLLYQKKIASILSAYDDLIENNLKRIKLLEEKAQLTYEEWFVRMKYPGHDNYVMDSENGLPKGWCISDVNSLLGKLPSKTKIKKSEILDEGLFPVIDQSRDFISGYTNEASSVYKASTLNPIIVFGDHTRILKLIQFDFSRGADGTQLITSSRDGIPNYFLYLTLSQIDLSNYSYARHFKYLKIEEVVIPDALIIQRFEELVIPVFKTCHKLREINRLLISARDLLLPRLMSGMIDIDEIKYNYPKEISA